MIKQIVLEDGDRNDYVINVEEDDGTTNKFVNPYDNNSYHYDGIDYNNNLMEELIKIIKGELPESLLLLHLNIGLKGSLHKFMAYQLMKIPKSITLIDNRTKRK